MREDRVEIVTQVTKIESALNTCLKYPTLGGEEAGNAKIPIVTRKK